MVDNWRDCFDEHTIFFDTGSIFLADAIPHRESTNSTDSVVVEFDLSEWVCL